MRELVSPPGRTLFLVVARSGSKGVPGKNVRSLGGMPLLAWRVRQALALADPQDVWVSTDSPGYADVARAHGASVPFLRPESLATDTARAVDVALHALEEARKLGRDYRNLAHLEPTSPFVPASRLAQAIAALEADAEAENIVAVRKARPGRDVISPMTTYMEELAANLSRLGLARRQDEALEVTPSGGFYIAKVEAFLRNRSYYTARTMPLLVPDEESLEIDEPIDFMWAEFLLEKGLVDPAGLWKTPGEGGGQ